MGGHYCESTEETVLESIVVVLGHFGMTVNSQKILFASKLFPFYCDALLGSKTLSLTFIASVKEDLKGSAGGEEGELFCAKVLDSQEKMQLILTRAKSPYINEREIVYQLFEQLAAIRFGRELIFKTDGLLVWLTDRDQIVESNPEAVWRFGILQQLITLPDHCKECIGDHG